MEHSIIFTILEMHLYLGSYYWAISLGNESVISREQVAFYYGSRNKENPDLTLDAELLPAIECDGWWLFSLNCYSIGRVR